MQTAYAIDNSGLLTTDLAQILWLSAVTKYIEATFDLKDDKVVIEGSLLVRFLDEAWSQLTDNRHRLWAFGISNPIQKDANGQL